MAIRCKHDWRIEDKSILPSPISQMTQEERVTVSPANWQPWQFQQTLVLVLICRACGKVEKQVTDSPGGVAPIVEG